MKLVVHTIDSMTSDKGGPSRTVPRLCMELATRTDWRPLLVSADSAVPAGLTGLAGMDSGALVRSASGRRYWPAVVNGLRMTGMNSRVLHDHGLWLASNAQACVIASMHHIPLVISPRGMLEEGALGHRSWKKRAAWRLYQQHLLRSATAFHATSPGEATSIRRMGLRQPIVVCPNGVELPPWTERSAVSGTRRRALFLSRLHPHKGVIELIEAWARVRPAGWQLTLVGPDTDGFRQRLAALVEQRSLGDSVEILPAIPDHEKWAQYQAADLFVLPSRSENFGVVVAEALASGLPVITTTGTPWTALDDRGCGWCVGPDVESLSSTIAHATGRAAATLRNMGVRGQQWASTAFSWHGIGQTMAAFYDWLSDGMAPGQAPSAVRMD